MRSSPSIKPHDQTELDLTNTGNGSRLPKTKSQKKAHGLLGLKEKGSRNKLTKLNKNAIVPGDVSAEVRTQVTEQKSLGSLSSLQTPLRSSPSMGSDSGLYALPSRLDGNPTRRAKVQDASIASQYSNKAPESPTSRFVNGKWSPSSPASAHQIRGQHSNSASPCAGPESRSPMLHETSSDSRLAPVQVKSALKQSRSTMDVKSSPSSPSNASQTKRLGFSSFLSKPQLSSTRKLSPSRFWHSPTEITEMAENFPEHTTHAALKRRTQTGRLEVITTTAGNPSVDSSSADTSRVKVFDRDVFDSSRRTVRRPPKGIQNWFDGVDVSSEEGEHSEDDQPKYHSRTGTVESVTTLPPQLPDLGESPIQPFLPELDSQRIVDSPVAFSSQRLQRVQNVSHEMDAVSCDYTQTRSSSNAIFTSDVTTATTVAHSSSSGLKPRNAVIPEQKQQRPESRAAPSRFGSRSVLTLSDTDDDEDDFSNDPHYVAISGREEAGNGVTKASSISMQRPTIPPRKIHPTKFEESHRQRRPNVQVSFEPAGPSNDRVLPEPSARASRNASITTSDTASSGRRLSTTPSKKRFRSHRLSASTNQDTNHDDRSSGRVTSISSVPSRVSDGDHLMAVTQEEMILLEMMRKKRAAMQDDTGTGSHGIGLREAMAQLKMKRESAHFLEMEMLKRRELMAAAANIRHRAQESVTSIAMTGPSDRSSRAFSSSESDLSYEQRRQLSTILREEEENARRIERFLRQQSPVDDKYPTSLPDSMIRRPTNASDRDSSRYSQFEESLASPISRISPMQRLTQRLTEQAPIRDSYSTTFEEQDWDDLIDKARMASPTQAQTASKRMSRARRASSRQQAIHPAEFDADVSSTDGEDRDNPAYLTADARDATTFPPPPPHQQRPIPGEQGRHAIRISVQDTPRTEEETVPETPHLFPIIRGPLTPPSEHTESGALPTVHYARKSSPNVHETASNSDTGTALLLPSRKKRPDVLRISPEDHQQNPLALRTFLHNVGGSNNVLPNIGHVPLTPNSIAASAGEERLKRDDVRNANVESTTRPPETELSPPSDVDQLHQVNTHMPRAPTKNEARNSAIARVPGMNSIANASDDVLAAWAELGGSNEGYVRRRSNTPRFASATTTRNSLARRS